MPESPAHPAPAAARPQRLLEVAGLGKRIGERTILNDVSFSLAPGHVLVVLGDNGAGKSTLLRLLAGISRPQHGRILFLGAALRLNAAFLRAEIGYLSHDPLLYDELSATENLLFFAQAYGVPARATAVASALARWGLAWAADQPVKTFSRGMRQRLALARTWLHRPALVLLDEPTTGLDAAGRTLLLRELDAHCRDGGGAVVTTHEGEFFAQLPLRAARLQAGRLVWHDAV